MIGKRKRKTEKELNILREELKQDYLWTKEKIVQLSRDLNMSKTSIYKWWWDQTKKQNGLLRDKSLSNE